MTLSRVATYATAALADAAALLAVQLDKLAETLDGGSA